MTEDKMNYDYCINDKGVYECFICNKEFKHNNSKKFEKHLSTIGHINKMEKLGYGIEDIEKISNIYNDMYSYYGVSSILYKIQNFDFDDRNWIYFPLLEELKKYNKRYEFKEVYAINMRINKYSPNRYYRNHIENISVYDKELKKDIRITTIPRQKYLENHFQDFQESEYFKTLVYYNEIKDIELKLICDIIFKMPRVQYFHRPRDNDISIYKYKQLMKRINYKLFERISINEGQKLMKIKNYIFNSPYWCEDIGSIINMYI